MHSSRMRTARCSAHLKGGGCMPGEMSAWRIVCLGVVCLGDVCLGVVPRRCLPREGVSVGGGVSTEGVICLGGLPSGVSAQGDVCLVGISPGVVPAWGRCKPPVIRILDTLL